jgi:probable phosphoglycerate mutase
MQRRRILLMRHGAVDYFDARGRPYPPDDVPLTPDGERQARAMGEAIAAAGVRIDRALTSGLKRTRATAEHVLAAAGMSPPIEHRAELQEIRGGRLAEIPDAELRAAFIAAFEGPVPRETRFLNGETIGALLDRVLPAVDRLLDDADWDTVLLVLHGGVNRGILSWFLTGQPVFLGGLAQDPGCLNVIDVGASPATSIVRVVNFCPIEPLQTGSRLSTMEHLLGQYMKLRAALGDAV